MYYRTAVFLVFMVAFVYGQERKTSLETSEDSARVAIKNEWVEAAISVAKETGDDEALALARKVLLSMATAAPLPDGFRTIEEAKIESDAGMYLIPVLKNDPGPKETISLGYFLGGPRLIFIRETANYTVTQKGVALLREIRFATFLIYNPKATPDTPAFLDYRIKAIDFGKRLFATYR